MQKTASIKDLEQMFGTMAEIKAITSESFLRRTVKLPVQLHTRVVLLELPEEQKKGYKLAVAKHQKSDYLAKASSARQVASCKYLP
jgi:hypothetical protein